MPWQKGQSGNPAGRKRDSHINAARVKLARHLSEVIDAVILAALNGDMRAARLILERLIPPVAPDYEKLAERLANLEAKDHDSAGN